MPELETPGSIARFKGFELDLRSGELRPIGGNRVRLSDQPFRILSTLLQRPGEVVLRDEMRKALWPNDTVVEFEHSINTAINRLRQALGDAAENPRYIETLARRGYRWMVPVEWVEPTPAGPGSPAVATPESPSSAANWIGKKVSHYRVLEVLGGGGMGVIYKAEDLKLGRRVALKFLPEEVASEPSALERFEREARAASALNHPNICAIYEFGEHEGQPFIAMELLEGQTLRERIGAQPPQPGKPLATNALLDFAIQITRGLEVAHQKGIIHRDIKPANIFITNRGEAKILDFGVAKLVHGDGHPGGSAHSESPDDALPFDPSSPLNLTRTGTTVGTASYMSPEQIRSEKLDARTDLFSFGLVLHEMATGQQAFAGDTAVVIREAILHRSVRPAQQLNPELPTKIEEVLAGALQKDREARYQTASEIRAVVEKLKRDMEPRPPVTRWRKIAAVLAVALLVAVTVFWFAKRQPTSPSHPPEVRLRELTFNSAEKGFAAGSISPDGKYLAFTDTSGIHIQLAETGESLSVSQPARNSDKANWEVTAWFPDSTRFLVNSHPPGQGGPESSSERSSIWLVSVLGAAPRKVRDTAYSYSVSPDGSLISFGTNKGRFGDREIWLMDASGEHARKLFDCGEDSSIGGLIWSPNGQRMLYTIVDDSGQSVISRDPRGGAPITIIPPSPANNGNEYLWLPDGRLIYTSYADPNTGGIACSFWQMRLDASSGKPIEQSKCMANWPTFSITGLSVTADGKRLAFLKMTGHPTTYVADLDANGTRIANLRHFTLTDSIDMPADWTADSNAIIFTSNRTGHFGIYKQALNEDTAKLLASEMVMPRVGISADGDWVLYQHETELRRVPVSGGSPEVVTTLRPDGVPLRARSPSNLSAIAEPTEDRKQMVITAIDPVKGRGSELTRFVLDPTRDVPDGRHMDLSPDGTRIAAILSPEGPIHVLSLRGLASQEIRVKGWTNITSVRWAADGNGILISNGVQGGAELLHVDLRGNAQVLWKNPGVNWAPVLASPDGRHVAFQSAPGEGNMWLMENF